jgi:hypothetical protein
VLLSDGHWLVVEPTPGYEVLGANRSLGDRALDAVAAVAGWLVRNLFGVGAAVLAVVGVAWRRKRIADRAHTLLWKLSPGRTWERMAVRSARLLERRGALAGRTRRPDETLSAWAARLGPGHPRLRELASLVEWAAYAPHLPPPHPPERVAETCRSAVAESTLARLRTARWSWPRPPRTPSTRPPTWTGCGGR